MKTQKIELIIRNTEIVHF